MIRQVGCIELRKKYCASLVSWSGLHVQRYCTKSSIFCIAGLSQDRKVMDGRHVKGN